MQGDEVLVELFEAILKSPREEIATDNQAGSIEEADQSGSGASGEPEQGIGFFFGNDLVELLDLPQIFEGLEVFLAKNHGDRSGQKESNQVYQSRVVEVI